jgi:inosine triphosphate pyrophosphatase
MTSVEHIIPSELGAEPLIQPHQKKIRSPFCKQSQELAPPYNTTHIFWRNKNKTDKMTAPSEARHIVNFITGNANKLIEVKAILEPAIQVENQELDLIEIQGTLEEVTLDKCRRAADLVTTSLSLVSWKTSETNTILSQNRPRAPSW